MNVAPTIVQRAVSLNPRATVAFPDSWRPLLSPGAEQIDTAVLASLTGQIADPAGVASFNQLVGPKIRESAAAGVTFVAMLAGDGDVPVAATLLVSPLPAVPTNVTQLEVEWRVRSPRTFRRVALPVGPALISVATREIAVDDISSADAYDWQIAIPHPASGGVLMAFSTPLVPIKEIFEDVFLAIARTTRWQRTGRVS